MKTKFSFAVITLSALLCGCTELNDGSYPYGGRDPYRNDPYYGGGGYNGGYGGRYDNGYDNRYSRERDRAHDERRALERERERAEEERERLERERRELERNRHQYSPPPSAPPVYREPRREERCPAGFSPSEQKCSTEERRRGCRDMRLPGGLGCVDR